MSGCHECETNPFCRVPVSLGLTLPALATPKGRLRAKLGWVFLCAEHADHMARLGHVIYEIEPPPGYDPLLIADLIDDLARVPEEYA